MYVLIVTEKGGSPKRMEFDKDEVTIGRVPGNDVILPKGNVSKRHSRVVRQDGRFFVVDLKSTNGTYLNGRRITTPSVIRPGDKIYVGDFVMVLDQGEDATGTADAGEELEATGALMGEPLPADDAVDEPPPATASPESSLLERVPLEVEPPDSIPPPVPAAPPFGGPPRLPMSAPGNGPPSMTAPPGLGMRPALPTTQGLGAAGNPPVRPTQPPPPRAMPSVPGRPNTPSLPGAGALGARPPGATPSNMSMPAVPSAMPPMRAPGSVGAAGAPPLQRSPSGEIPRRPAPTPSVAAPVPPSISPPGEDFDEPSTNARNPVGQFIPIGAEVPTPTNAPAKGPATVPPPSITAATTTANVPVEALAAVLDAQRAVAVGPGASSAEPTPPRREYAALLAEVIAAARANGASSPADKLADAVTRGKVRAAVEETARAHAALPSGVTVERVVRDATAEIAGAGPIELALEEPEVTTVVVDANGRVLVGRGDAVGASPYWFSAPAAVATAVERLMHAAGVRGTAAGVVEVTLADGARMLAVLAPAASAGPAVVVERAPSRAATLVELAGRGVLSAPAAKMLEQAVAARRNVLVTGARGSGRTTLLAALVASAGAERAVLVEDRRELSRSFPELTAIDAGNDWRRALDIALRLRPQRLVVGDAAAEGAAAVLLPLLATGSEGVLAAVEGATATIALARFAERAAAQSGLARDEALARIAATRPFVVHLARLGDGTCRAVALGEVRAGDGGALQLDEAFALRIERAGAPGRLSATLASTGSAPSFASSS